MDDTSLDLYARMVRRAVGVPVALVSLVEEDRQVFPGAVGLPQPWQRERQTPLSHSFCQYVVRDAEPLVVSDAREVDLLADNLAIPDLGVVAYAGWPLVDHTGRTIGSLCAIDTVPRRWTGEELEALEDIAAACSLELAERSRRQAALVDLEESEQYGERSRLLLALSEGLSATRSLVDIAAAISTITRRELGCTAADLWLLDGLADALDGALGDDPRLLRLTRDERTPAPSYDGGGGVLPLDAGHPLGAVLLGLEALFVDDDPARTYAVLPLLVGDRPLGVLELTWPEERGLALDDRVTVSALGAYTAQAVERAALLEDRVAVSVTLQRAMLSELPAVPQMQLAARYLPAARRDQVGGDWYDVVRLRSGATLLAVGDVVGHDITAAAHMGQLRSMLRGIASTVEEAPSQILERLDEAVERLEVAVMASAQLVRVEPEDGGWRACWSSAGHLPMLVVEPDGTPSLPQGPAANDRLLGVGPGDPRRDHDVLLRPGSVLLMYSDGLTERRGEPLDTGVERLLATVAAEPAGDLDTDLDTLLDRLVDTLVDDRAHDDVVVLAARVC